MVINTNMAAMTAANNLDKSTTSLNNALAELSSGSKLTTPANDPAGLAESIALTAQIGQTNAANSNVSNAISFSQTQDGYLQQVGSALDEMSTLAVEAQDPTKSGTQLSDYNAEYQALSAYINTTANATFNGVSLFTGTNDDSDAGIGLTVTTDGNGGTFTMTSVNLNAATYQGATVGADISTSTGASLALTAISTAISQLATDRANVGANEERLNYTSDELGVLSDNLTAANSNLTDVDVATESTTYAEFQILVQSGTAMLAQANQNPQSVLKLLS